MDCATSNIEPHEDMEFDSNEAAYEFYKEYAKTTGFGTAKLSSRRSRATKEFIDAKFSCIRYGNKQQSDNAINPRPSPKIGCKASLHVKRKSNGKWYVYSFVKEHNHDLLPAQAHLFRSHRAGDPVSSDVKMPRRKLLNPVFGPFHAYHNVERLDSYLRNELDKGRRLCLESKDAQLLLEFFMNMQDEEPKFMHALDLNEEYQLRNVFWVNAKGVDDYQHFGDVVCFDTMYYTNKYKMPLVLFIGVNHHTQPTLFGCALIADDTVNTFIWLMQTWLVAVGGRPPHVILTDQNKSLKTAIETTFSGTCHYLSLWHVMEGTVKQLEYLSIWLDAFMERFKDCIYASWTEEQFAKKWWELVDEFKLKDDDWMQFLFENRFLWVPLFSRGVSFSGLSTPSRSEGLCSYFDQYVNSDTSLSEFLEHSKLMLEDQCEEEARANFDAWHEAPELRSPSPLEKQMSFVYTNEIFKKFQDEVLGAAACHLKKEKEDDEANILYSVKDFEADTTYSVQWNAMKSDICCSCRLFEFRGYLCRHTIVVLQMSGVVSIPRRYILQRWTLAAKSKLGFSEKLEDTVAKIRRYNELCRWALILSEEGSLSQESCDTAVSDLKQALQQCATYFVPMDSSPNNGYVPCVGSRDEVYNQLIHTGSTERERDPQVDKGKDVQAGDLAMKETANELHLSQCRTDKGPQEPGVPISGAHDDAFPHAVCQGLSSSPHLQNLLPLQFHDAMPNIFQGMAPTTTCHNVAVLEKHVP